LDRDGIRGFRTETNYTADSTGIPPETAVLDRAKVAFDPFPSQLLASYSILPNSDWDLLAATLEIAIATKAWNRHKDRRTCHRRFPLC
jgi:hypothetical protein